MAMFVRNNHIEEIVPFNTTSNWFHVLSVVKHMEELVEELMDLFNGAKDGDVLFN